MVARERLAPVFDDPDEAAASHVSLDFGFRQIGEAHAAEGGLQHHGNAVEDELAVDAHAEFPALPLEFPGVEAAARRQAQVDAAVRRQVLRRLGAPPAFEISGRADDGHAHLRPERHGDHVPGNELHVANVGVVAPSDDVGQAEVDVDLHLDFRIVRQEALELGPENKAGGVLVGGDADRAGRLLAQFRQGRKLGIDFLEPRGERMNKPLARLGGRYAPGRPGQQAQAETGFQVEDGLAQRGLRDAQFRRRPGEAALLRDGKEGSQVVQVLLSHSLAILINPIRQ